MPIPTLPTAPDAPARTQDNATFNARMAAMMAFLEALPDELNAWAEALADLANALFTATSASNVAIGTGAKAFAASAGASFIGGQAVLISSDANPANFMQGTVTSYDSETGALVVNVTLTGGAGSHADWSIALTISAGALLDSPAITGIPTAPTAALGTNTTQLATTAFVAAAVAALIDASPGALDTLNELAAALGDDANFAATMTTALAAKYSSADLASQAEAQAGAVNTKLMTPLRVAQAIAALSPSYWTDVVLGADYSTTATTPSDITGMSFVPDANSKYVVEGLVLLQGTATVVPRLNAAWTGVDYGGIHIDYPGATQPTAQAVYSTMSGAIGNVTTASGSLPAASPYLWAFRAVFDTGAAAGLFELQLESETAGTAVTAKAGSLLRYRKLS